MYNNEIAVWNRNRNLYFKAGMVLSLFVSYTFLNLEFVHHTIGHNMIFEEAGDRTDLSLLVHREEMITPVAPRPKPVIPSPVSALPAPVFVPVPVETQAMEDVPLNAPDVVPSPRPVTVAIPPPAEKTEPVPTLIMAQEMPFLEECKGLSDQERYRCSEKAMMAHIYRYLKYPSLAREHNIQGTVVISFVIDRKGDVGQITIARDIGGGCGKAAAETILSLGKWVPGYQNQKAVNVKYMIPIKFVLQQ